MANNSDYFKKGCTSFYCFDNFKRMVIVCDSEPGKEGILNPQDFCSAEAYFLNEDFDPNKHLLNIHDKIRLNPGFLLSRTIRSKEKKVPVSLSFKCESYLFAFLSQTDFTLNNNVYFKGTTTSGAQQTDRLFDNICNELEKYHDPQGSEKLKAAKKEALFDNDNHGNNTLKVHCLYRHYYDCEKETKNQEGWICSKLQDEIESIFDKGVNIVALSGISGSGKSVAASLYGQTSSRIHNVFLLNCDDMSTGFSLQMMMKQYLYFNGKKVSDIVSAYNALTCQDSSTLLIVDNLNLATDELVQQLQKIRCPMIITSTLSAEAIEDAFHSLNESVKTGSEQTGSNFHVINLNHYEHQKELGEAIFFSRIDEDDEIHERFDKLMSSYDYHIRLCGDLARFIEDESKKKSRKPIDILNTLSDDGLNISENFLNRMYQQWGILTREARELLGAIIEIDDRHIEPSLLKKMVNYDENELNKLIRMNILEKHSDCLRIHPVVLKALTRRDAPIAEFNEETSLRIWKNYLLNVFDKPLLLFSVANHSQSIKEKEHVIRISHNSSKLASLIDQYTHTENKMLGVGRQILPAGSVLDEIIVNGNHYLLFYQNDKIENPFLLLKNEDNKLLFYNLNSGECYPKFYPNEHETSKLQILCGIGCIYNTDQFPEKIENRGLLQFENPSTEENQKVLDKLADLKQEGDFNAMQEMVASVYNKAVRRFQSCPTNENCRFFFDIAEQKRFINAIFFNTMPEIKTSGIGLMDYSYLLLEESIILHEHGLFQLSRVPVKKQDFADIRLFESYYYYGVNQYRQKRYADAVVSFENALDNAFKCSTNPELNEDMNEHYSYLYHLLAQAMEKSCQIPDETKAQEILDYYTKAVHYKDLVCKSLVVSQDSNKYQSNLAVYMLYLLDLTNFMMKINYDEQEILNGFNETGFIVSLLDLTVNKGREETLLHRADHVLKYYNDRLRYELSRPFKNIFVMDRLIERGNVLILKDKKHNIFNPTLIKWFNVYIAEREKLPKVASSEETGQ